MKVVKTDREVDDWPLIGVFHPPFHKHLISSTNRYQLSINYHLPPFGPRSTSYVVLFFFFFWNQLPCVSGYRPHVALLDMGVCAILFCYHRRRRSRPSSLIPRAGFDEGIRTGRFHESRPYKIHVRLTVRHKVCFVICPSHTVDRHR